MQVSALSIHQKKRSITMASVLSQLQKKPFFIKLFNWEYWSFNTVYLPIVIYWFWLSVKARSFFFFSAANPSIKNGGFLMESKKEIYDLLPPEYCPQTLFFTPQSAPQYLLGQVHLSGLEYPLIAKPDIGMQGIGVKKISSNEELIQYLQHTRVNFLVQEWIPYEKEIGLFYCRMPGSEKGVITGIVEKEFLSITGDGTSTFSELLMQQSRYILQLPALQKLYAKEWNEVLEKGAIKLLVPYGNHARGAKFIDKTNWADEDLTNIANRICTQIPGFYFGRLDLRYDNLEDLRKGEKFSIIELNGSGSEPTHMYDPAHSIWFAWKEIIRHWIWLQKISAANHKLGAPYLSYAEGMKMFKESKEYNRLLKGSGK
jgi:hypothetical protein